MIDDQVAIYSKQFKIKYQIEKTLFSIIEATSIQANNQRDKFINQFEAIKLIESQFQAFQQSTEMKAMTKALTQIQATISRLFIFLFIQLSVAWDPLLEFFLVCL